MMYLAVYDVAGLYWFAFIGVLPLFYVSLRLAIFCFVSLYRMLEYENIDWYNRYLTDTLAEKLDWDKVKHYVVIPNYKENEETIHNTLDNLSRSSIAKSHICVVLAMETRESGYQQKAERLIEQFNPLFREMMFTGHPSGLPGEIPGKSSNENWACQQLKEILEERGEDVKKAIVSITDADSHHHEKYFDCLTYKFCTDPDRHCKFYQPFVVGYSNYYEVPAILRCVSFILTVHEFGVLSDPLDHHIPFSTYSLSLHMIEQVGGFDPNIITEDWHMYFKSFFNTDGRAQTEPIYLATTNTIVSSDNGLVNCMSERFKQAIRHLWSYYEVCYLLERIILHPGTLFSSSWKRFLRGSSLIIKVFIIHFLAIIPVPLIALTTLWHLYHSLVVGDAFMVQLSFPARALQTLIVFNQIFILSANYVLLRHIHKERPNTDYRSNYFYGILEYFILSPVSTVLFTFAPAIFCITKQMFTDKHTYVVAPKPKEEARGGLSSRSSSEQSLEVLVQ